MNINDANRGYAALLGWSPATFEADGFDEALARKISDWQLSVELPPSGICDRISYQTLLNQDSIRTKERADELRNAGEQAVKGAKSLWLEMIIDPPDDSVKYAHSRERINQFIRGAEGLYWTWESEYERDGDFMWCGAFVAYAWGMAGLNQQTRKRYFASTYRLDRYGRYRALDDEPVTVPANPTERRRWLRLDQDSGVEEVIEFDPRPGDILLVGDEDSAHGSHVTLVEEFDPVNRCFITLEGNALGAWPNGRWVQGVARRCRPIGKAQGDSRHARRLIRPSVLDLDLP